MLPPEQQSLIAKFISKPNENLKISLVADIQEWEGKWEIILQFLNSLNFYRIPIGGNLKLHQFVNFLSNLHRCRFNFSFKVHVKMETQFSN